MPDVGTTKKIEEAAKRKADEAIQQALPFLSKGEIPPTKVKDEDLTAKGQLARQQAAAKKEVERSGDVEMNVGQARNVGEGQMVLRTTPRDDKVDAITGAAPVLSGKGGAPAQPVSGAIPPQDGPQIAENGPPPDIMDLETPDMRMKDSGAVANPPQPTGIRAALDTLEKEEGPGFWDILEAAAAGWSGRDSKYAQKQGDKRKEASQVRLMEKETAMNKANQLELMAKQAEIAGKADEAAALREEASAQKRQAERIALLEKEYGLKKGAGGDMMELVGRLMGGGK